MCNRKVRYLSVLAGLLYLASPLVAATIDVDATLGPIYDEQWTFVRDGLVGPVTVVLDGGAAGDMSVFGRSTLIINSGIYVDLDTYDFSTVRINGGQTVGDGVFASDNSSITIFAGGFGEPVFAGDRAVVNIYGGSFGLVGSVDEGIVNIYGRELTATFVSGPSTGGGPGDEYSVRGFLADGTSLFDDDMGVVISSTSSFFLHNVPEPSGVALFGIMCLVFGLRLDRNNNRVQRERNHVCS